MESGAFEHRVRAEPWRPRIEDLAAEAARHAARAPEGSDGRDRYAGLHAGLLSSLRGARVLADGVPPGSEMRVAGLLAGNLQAALLRRSGTVPEQLLLVCTAYGASVAGWIASKGAVTDSDRAVMAHTTACLRIERRRLALSAADERACFAWLLEQSGVAPTNDLLERYERTRVRRLERTRGTGRGGRG